MHERPEKHAGSNQPRTSKPPRKSVDQKPHEYKHHVCGGVTVDQGTATYTQKMQAGGHDHRPERQDAAASETCDQRSSAERPGIS